MTVWKLHADPEANDARVDFQIGRGAIAVLFLARHYYFCNDKDDEFS